MWDLDGGFSKGKDTISFEEDIADFIPTMGDPNRRNPSRPRDPNDIVDVTNKQIAARSEPSRRIWIGLVQGRFGHRQLHQWQLFPGSGHPGLLEFEFDDTDTSADSKAFGDGFSFSLVSGANYTDGDTGAGGEYMGYAGAGLSSNGLQPPKLAVEIDTYPNPGAGSVCGDDSRRDDGDANHAALVYWGEENVGSFDTWPRQSGTSRWWSAYLQFRFRDWSSSQGTISFWFKRDTISIRRWRFER